MRIAPRPAWADRFRSPTSAQLLAGIPAAMRPTATMTRERLRKYPQATESLAWLGTWQWTLQFRTPTSNGVSWVYLIPNPQRPQVCIPVHDTTLAAVAPKLLSRSIRETLLFAPTVDGVRWATWDVQSRTQMEALLAFAEACATAHTPHQK
ncbi:MAG: hypothetical protein ACK5VN_11145 [Phycisphaerae bacterium]